jgi:7-cyano-7-deazaguanine synthase
MAVILLSGGLDSSLNLALAARAGEARMALTALYGQRAEAAECRAAEALAKYYKVPWRSVNLEWLGTINPTGLTRPEQTLPHLALGELDQLDIISQSMKAVWVANRNGVLLNIAAAHAEAFGLNRVYVGFNREEAATFADNSQQFMTALNKSLSYSTLNGVEVRSFTTNLDKLEILKEAMAIELPLEHVWSCYEAGPERCWKCESCGRTKRGLLKLGDQGKLWLEKMGAPLD